jgi:hypothetical protein
MARALARRRRLTFAGVIRCLECLEPRVMMDAGNVRSIRMPLAPTVAGSTSQASASTATNADDATDIIDNGSFELTGVTRNVRPDIRSSLRQSPSSAPSGITYLPTDTGWTFSGASGIQTNGSGFGAPPAPDGTQTAFLQSGGAISQTINIEAGGIYTFQFQGALRSYRSAGTPAQQIAVYVDDMPVGTYAPTSDAYWDRFTFSQGLSAGQHTISFRTTVTLGDSTAFLDNFSIISIQLYPAPQFSVSSVDGVDSLGRNTGFGVADVTLVPTDGSDSSIVMYPTMVDHTVLADSTVLETWSTPGGEVRIDAQLSNQGDDELMNVTVTAGAFWTVKEIDLAAPWIYAPITSTLKTFSAFQSGVVQDWPSTGWYQQNSSVWPEMGYSPIAVFYDSATTEGVGFVSFDSGLKSRQVYWYTGPGEVHPFVGWDAGIAPGQSATTEMALHHGFNMPTDHFLYYRNNFLKPFMDSQGVTEGSLPVSGVMGTTGWPPDSDVSQGAQWARSWGATGYLQYAPPDGSAYYEPDPQTLGWYPTLSAASNVPGLEALGVLINPFMASHSTPPTSDPSDPAWFPGGWGSIDITDPAVQDWLARLRTDLAANGVNFAYWDGGHAVPYGAELAWFNILKTWKLAGISIAVESSNDLASYVTGTNLFYEVPTVDSVMVRTITPDVTPVVVNPDMTPDADGNYWWDTALARGWVPILDQYQLPIYGQKHGFTGISLS